MMNDVPRNTAFEAAIRKVIAAARQPSGACRVAWLIVEVISEPSSSAWYADLL